ncbi:hypothetical protein ACHAW6_013677 [Cyclotella cf. meneghiniana]
MLGSPAKANFEGMVRGKLIDDCPIDVVDLQNTHTIFGPDLMGIRGRTVRRRPEQVATDIVAIPQDFVWMQFLPQRTAKMIGAKLTRVLQLNNRAGFTVQTALMDKEFDPVANQCPTLPINTSAANEHIPEI